jgi:hypothetical protein
VWLYPDLNDVRQALDERHVNLRRALRDALDEVLAD